MIIDIMDPCVLVQALHDGSESPKTLLAALPRLFQWAYYADTMIVGEGFLL